MCYWLTNNTHHIGHVYNVTIYYIRNVDDNKYLLDDPMSKMKIYSVETKNIRRGEAELDILGETE